MGTLNILAEISSESHELDVIFLLGLAVFGGTIGARIFRRLHIPQIIGYIVIGLVIGESGLRLVSEGVLQSVEHLNYFALGIIGFVIGGELKAEIMRRYGKQFTTILVAEGMGAFLVVGTGVCLLTWTITKDLRTSVALGVVLGAISSATDPASTIQVLWEYKTRGPLTTATIAVVALDDALALTLYALGTSIAGILTGREGSGVATSMVAAVYELGGALLVGFVGGIILRTILVRIREEEAELTFVIGAVLLAIGLAITLRLDVILASMTLGLTLVNAAPRRSESTFDIVKRFAPPIYVLFFVLVGARLKVTNMSLLVWFLVGTYVLGRSAGKITGAYLGGRLSGAAECVRRYLGVCLFAQGGVAIGLSILASHRFTPQVSSMVILVVASTTFIVQLIGPLFVRYGVRKAGEVGMNVTEEDLIGTYHVHDVMETTPPTISSDMSLAEVIRLVSRTESLYYPVIGPDSRLLGAITLHGIRNTFATQELNDWLIALDIMEPVTATVTPQTPLAQALATAQRNNAEHVPVVASETSDELAGLLDCRAARRSLSAEVLSRQKKADNMQSVVACDTK